MKECGKIFKIMSRMAKHSSLRHDFFIRCCTSADTVKQGKIKSTSSTKATNFIQSQKENINSKYSLRFSLRSIVHRSANKLIKKKSFVSVATALSLRFVPSTQTQVTTETFRDKIIFHSALTIYIHTHCSTNTHKTST